MNNFDKKKKVVAIIQARMGSTRLPGKIFKKIHQREILDYVVTRVNKSKEIDEVVIATTVREKDDIIENFCNERGIKVFRGSEDDVLDRYYQCAKTFSGDIIVRVTSDCPLIDWEVIDYYVKYYKNNEIDYVVNTWFDKSYPSGFDVEVLSFDILEKYWKYEKDIKKREHACNNIKNYPDLFKYVKHSNIKNNFEDKYNYLHLSVDIKEDFLLIKKIIEHFNGNINIKYQDIMNYITDDMIEFNMNDKRKEKIKTVKQLK